MKMSFDAYDKLENLPSLQKGWIRLVHRCIMHDGKNVNNIKQNGLIFNRIAAKCDAYQKGGNYNHVTSMVSVYNEDTFWQSMQKDDFACFNDEKYADTKLVFDIPFEEFCFLQSYGRIIKGKIDSKYLVGCVKNVNAKNPQLKMPISEILKAEQLSKKNPPSSVKANNLTTMINCLIMKFPKERRAEELTKIYANMEVWKKEISDLFAEEKKIYQQNVLIKNMSNCRDRT